MSTCPTPDDLAVDIGRFNALDALEASPLLQSCLAVPRWVAEVLARRPYAGRAELLDQARQSAGTLTPVEVETALARHPRIGERAGQDHDADFSRREQAGVDAGDTAQTERLRRGNARYEARFGRVFLIRAAQRSTAEILAELERRLANSDSAEAAEVVAQLGEIAVLRLGELIAAAQPTPATRGSGAGP